MPTKRTPKKRTDNYGRSAQSNKFQRMEATVMADEHFPGQPMPLDWMLARWMMLTKNLGVSSMSDKGMHAEELGFKLIRMLHPLPKAVDVTVKADAVVTVEIGGGELEEDYSDLYELEEYSDFQELTE